MPSDTMPDVPSAVQLSTPLPSTIKRHLNRGLRLPEVQRHGFTHPEHGHYLMVPPEFDLVLAHEPTRVAQVILEVMRQTVGWVGMAPATVVSGQSFLVDTSPGKALWTGITPIKPSQPL